MLNETGGDPRRRDLRPHPVPGQDHHRRRADQRAAGARGHERDRRRPRRARGRHAEVPAGDAQRAGGAALRSEGPSRGRGDRRREWSAQLGAEGASCCGPPGTEPVIRVMVEARGRDRHRALRRGNRRPSVTPRCVLRVASLCIRAPFLSATVTTVRHMRRPIVAGNWKMHGSRAENAALLECDRAQAAGRVGATSWVCPPFVYLAEVARAAAPDRASRSARRMSAPKRRARSPVRCPPPCCGTWAARIVIVGHSERRALYHEDDALVARKFAAALAAGLTPILCVGETLEERESAARLEVVDRQLDAVLDLHGVAALSRAVIAYEPVWAIGTGRTASPAAGAGCARLHPRADRGSRC